MVAAAGAVPGVGGFEGLDDLSLSPVILVAELLPEGGSVGAELHLGAEGGEEGDENDVGLGGIEDAFGEGGGAVLRRGHEVGGDPVLGAVLLDERVVGVGGEGGGAVGGEVIVIVIVIGVGVGGEAGVGEGGPVALEEGVVEGSGEVGDVDVDGGGGGGGGEGWRVEDCGCGEGGEEVEGEGENGENGE